MAAAVPAQAAPAAPTAVPTAPTAVPATAPPGSVLWTLPLGGAVAVTRPVDPPADRYGRGHRGADLAGLPGSPVLAAGDGVVAFAGVVAGRPVVSVDHADGLQTTYAPVDSAVGTGQPVTHGSRVGTLLPGHAGCPVGPVAACLHWGLRRGETYLDPLLLLRPPGVRLLPLA